MTKLLLFSLSFLLFLSSTAGDDPTAFVYAGCSQPRYAPGSPYQYNVESLLSSLANAAAFSSYSNFTSFSASPSSPVFALFQCRGDLPLSECSSCVRSALSRLSDLCPSAASSAVQLRACYIRYGNDSFLGRPDTSLLYKTCATAAVAYGGGAFLPPAIPPYLRSTPGHRTASRPPELSEPRRTTQVKASCGGAASGEAYLGKCYIRYYSNGAQPYAYGGGGGGEISGEEHGDETGKTLAIILGLLAGVALIIIFLSFLRRNGNGKY
ncbi:hypothetical protein HPP92_026382 [Vanilla planifolia]|uniref:Gnk2-homologous domain-containing protein n=1 Tax=Vanilla planifolia TaxID=51239 RepID=A0A835PEJ9_VANPL|nr:hypothetical protein HPP92_026382 [Vanilla planifolia]